MKPIIAGLCLLLICSSSGYAEDEAIRFPAATVVIPAPDVSPDSIPKLLPDSLYVIDADAEVLLFASPVGTVKVSKEVGPITIRGRFIDGSGKSETRKFSGKAVFLIEPLKTGRVELIAVPVGASSEDSAIRKTVDVYTQAPQPPPIDPTPDVDPKPDPEPQPTVKPITKILILYESSANNSREQLNIIYSTAIRKFAKDNSIDIRVLDKDVPVRESEDWRNAVASAVASASSLPSLTIFREGKGTTAPIPETEKATLDYLKAQKGGN